MAASSHGVLPDQARRDTALKQKEDAKMEFFDFEAAAAEQVAEFQEVGDKNRVQQVLSPQATFQPRAHIKNQNILFCVLVQILYAAHTLASAHKNVFDLSFPENSCLQSSRK